MFLGEWKGQGVGGMVVRIDCKREVLVAAERSTGINCDRGTVELFVYESAL